MHIGLKQTGVLKKIKKRCQCLCGLEDLLMKQLCLIQCYRNKESIFLWLRFCGLRNILKTVESLLTLQGWPLLWCLLEDSRNIPLRYWSI